MKVEALKKERVKDFVEYCRRHKTEVDDSFLHEEDLRDFEPNDENPTYIVTNQRNELVAAASLIIDDYNRRGKKGRFRIFHSETEDIEYYSMMLQTVLKHTDGLDKVFIFIPLINTKVIEIIEKLKFKIERYSFILVREALEFPEYSLPKDYEIRPFRAGKDEETWCEVRNAGFAKLQGSETPATPEMIAKMASDEDYIEGGMMMLYHEERAVGVTRGCKEEYEGAPIMYIGPLAIIPEYQGKGLGRSLLRALLQFAKEKSNGRTMLCVNGENERAKALYIQEGFKQTEGAVCYKYDLV